MVEENIAISVKNISKTFRLYFDKGTSLKERVLFKDRRRYEDRAVIKDISFDVNKGEVIGLIGHNGCGKSTTLKMLSRIMYPDTGSIRINGRVSALIELAAGFHPDMTGRENIYTNAAIFGLTRSEIDARLQDIIDFSELEEFIDNPVRTYSSGMYMRLAFSVAINVEADILLIDEILAVGDVAFQTKCFNKLREIKAKGTTIVIVSHNLGQIEQICDRSIWINDGLIKEEGDPKSVHMDYLDFMIKKQKDAEKAKVQVRDEVPAQQKSTEEKKPAEVEQPTTAGSVAETQAAEAAPVAETVEEPKKRWGSQEARITSISIRTSDGTESRFFSTGDDVIIELKYELANPVRDAVFGIGIFNRDGVQCYGTNTRIDRLNEFNLEQSGSVILKLNNVPLLSGEYLLDFAIEYGQGIPVDYYREAAVIAFSSNIGDVGVTRVSHSWELDIK